jgi:hypothetical protein
MRRASRRGRFGNVRSRKIHSDPNSLLNARLKEAAARRDYPAVTKALLAILRAAADHGFEPVTGLTI